MSAPGNREVAYRLFAAEFDDASLSYSESDEERAPNYVVTPSGARVNRLFAVGVLTEVEDVNEELLRGRISDPTGAFVTYAGQYQPEATNYLDRTTPPEFVALTGKARTYEPEDGDRVFTSVRPESVNTVDAATRDRWVVATAEATLARLGYLADALEMDARGEDLRTALEAGGVPAALSIGIPLAIDHYDVTTAYVEELRRLAVEALELVAGDREPSDVRSLSMAPHEGGDADVGTLPTGVDRAAAEAALDTDVAGDDGAAVAGDDGSGVSDAEASETAVDGDDGLSEVDTTSEPTESEPSGTEATTEQSETTTTATDTERTGTTDTAGTETVGESGTTDDPVPTATDEEDADRDPAEPESTPTDAVSAGSESTPTETESTPTETESTPTPADDVSSGTDDAAGTPTDEPSPTTSTGGSADDLGDFDAGDDGAVETDDAASSEADDVGDFEAGDDDLFEMDDETREQVESEFGTEFSSGAEVDPAGEADIDVPDPDELAERAEGTAETEADDGATETPPTASTTGATASAGEGSEGAPPDRPAESPAAAPDPTPADTAPATEDTGSTAVESEAESTADEPESTADEPESTADEPGDDSAEAVDPADVDLESVVVETMSALDDGDGAERGAVISAVVDEYGVAAPDVEDAIQSALMSGRCYEPTEDQLKSI